MNLDIWNKLCFVNFKPSRCFAWTATFCFVITPLLSTAVSMTFLLSLSHFFKLFSSFFFLSFLAFGDWVEFSETEHSADFEFSTWTLVTSSSFLLGFKSVPSSSFSVKGVISVSLISLSMILNSTLMQSSTSSWSSISLLIFADLSTSGSFASSTAKKMSTIVMMKLGQIFFISYVSDRLSFI